jgi:hypothetical protein
MQPVRRHEGNSGWGRWLGCLVLAIAAHVLVAAWADVSPDRGPKSGTSAAHLVWLEPIAPDEPRPPGAAAPGSSDGPGAVAGTFAATAPRLKRGLKRSRAPAPTPTTEREEAAAVAMGAAERVEGGAAEQDTAEGAWGTAGHGRGAAGRGAAGAGNGSGAHGPMLLAADEPCRGLFPYSARAGHGEVTVVLDVTQTGVPHHPRVARELPAGQGFAVAARACAERLRFLPAVDPSGRPIESRSMVRLHFARRQ